MIRIGILGYGNLGRGVELSIGQNPDMTLAGIFTRRDPASVKTAGGKVCSVDALLEKKDEIDVLILCGGSATDLPEQSPAWAKHFHIVDSFDNHSRIPEHFAACDAAAQGSFHTALISAGWDPGMFSLQRVLGECALPQGKSYTFWGKGISQGHSDAIRRVEGVADARQYTIPVEEALEKVRSGENPELTTRQKHIRECFVVAKPGADTAKIEKEIKEMPAYFADYDTIVHFITQEELLANHSGMPHGGFVIRTGATGDGSLQRVEYALELQSNPAFTGSILVACARAVWKLANKGDFGAKTILDIPPAYLSPKSPEELRKNLL